MPVRVAAQKSTARIDTVLEACLRPTFLFSPELRHVLAQGPGQTRATRHRKMKRAIVHPELRSAAVGRSCETVYRSRHAGYPAPPAQIQTGGTTPSGSSLGSDGKRAVGHCGWHHDQLAVHASASGTRASGS